MALHSISRNILIVADGGTECSSSCMKPAHLGPELTNQPRCHKRSSITGPAAWLYKNLQEPHPECVFERSSGGIDTCEHSQGLTPGGFWNSRQMVYLWHSCCLWYTSARAYFFRPGPAYPCTGPSPGRWTSEKLSRPAAQQTQDGDQLGPTCLQPTLNTIHFRV